MRRAKYQPVKVGKRWRLNVPVSISENGKRRRLYYDTKGEAEVEGKRLRNLERDRGRSLTELSSAQSEDAVTALRLLEGHSVKLRELALEYLERTQCALTLEEVANRWLESRKRSSIYSSFARRTVDLLKPLFAKRIGAVTPAEIDHCLQGFAPSSRASKMRALGALWNYAIQRDYVSENPVLKLERPRRAKLAERPVVAPADLEAILNHCLKGEEKDAQGLIAALAILFFAGVRRFELLRLDWRDIDLEEAMIDLPAKITKRGRRRSIPIEPNLKVWLLRHVEINGVQDGRVCPWQLKSFYRRRDAVCRAVEVHWDQNMPRHSYASYWLAEHGDLNKLALHMGHVGGLEILHQHYYRCVRRADAQAYWGIMPTGSCPMRMFNAARQR